jgi:hypothetical protein
LTFDAANFEAACFGLKSNIARRFQAVLAKFDHI